MMSQRWYRKSRPTRSIVPVTRFISDTVFALKNGGYGCLFAVTGIDDEGLTDQAVADSVSCIYGALLALPRWADVPISPCPEGNDLPRKERYADSTVDAFVSDRIEFLNGTAHFHRIEPSSAPHDRD